MHNMTIDMSTQSSLKICDDIKLGCDSMICLENPLFFYKTGYIILNRINTGELVFAG